MFDIITDSAVWSPQSVLPLSNTGQWFDQLAAFEIYCRATEVARPNTPSEIERGQKRAATASKKTSPYKKARQSSPSHRRPKAPHVGIPTFREDSEISEAAHWVDYFESAEDDAVSVDRDDAPETDKRDIGKIERSTGLLPPDIWANIFEFCDVRALLAGWCVSRATRTALSYSSIWRQRRIGTWPESPDPPPSISERRYIALLSGNACERCSASPVHRIAFAFLKRWCQKCISKETINADEAEQVLENSELFQCVLMAERGKHVSRRRGHLSPVVRIKSLSSRGQIETLPHLSDAVFLREDVVQIRDWYNRNSQSLKDEPGADRPPWFTEKVRIIEAERKFSAEAHEWQASIQHKRYHELEKNRRNRLEYFVQQAAHMEEPLSADELRLIPAFNRAITLGTPPTEPAWKALKGRLEKARSIQHQETQKLEAQQLSLDGWNSPPPSPTLEYTFSSPLYVSQEDEKEFLHRFSYLQEFRAKKGLISRLRKVEMYMKGNLELIQSPEAFVLVGLRLVWQGLQEVRNMAMWSPSLFPDSEVFWSDDVGDLTLEDAIVAYRELLRACSEMGGGDKSLLLRCPGCIGSLRSYHSLGNLLAHQVSSHSHEFSGFMRLEPAGPWDGRYLFRNVPWPANLPMLIPGIRQDAVAGEWSFDGPAHPIDFVVKGRVSIIRIDTRCHLIDRSIARLHHHGWQQQCGSGQ